MINHARTLLLNRTRVYFNRVRGAHYIPPDYQPVEVPRILQPVRNALIPASLDKLGELYVVEALLRVLHAPDIEPYIRMLDSRYTYLDQPTVLDLTAANPIQVSNHKDAASDVLPVYETRPENYPSDMFLAGHHRWIITPTDSTHVRIVYNRGGTDIIPITNGTTRSEVINLIPGYLSTYLNLPSKTLTGKFRLECSTDLAVPYNLGTIEEMILRYTSRPGIEPQIFSAVAGYEKQVEELYDTWKYNRETQLRVSAVAMSLIYQLENVRLNRGQRR